MTVFGSLSHFKQLVNHPLFRFPFFSGIVLLLVWVFYSFPLWQTLNAELNKAELLLLDSRLKFKQGSQLVDDRIVLVGKDRTTDDFGRNHPDMGLTGGALPRERLADIVTYLSREGAKAIVLDVEFKNKTSATGDDALSKAIKQAGNVYLANDFYINLAQNIPPSASSEIKKNTLQACQNSMAIKFAQQADFLKQLDDFKLPIEKKLDVISPLSINMSRCYSEAFVLHILQSAKGLGAVSVDYSAEGFLREVPLLVQGYRGNLYGYLGVTPALEILKPQKMILKADALDIETTGKSTESRVKTIPLNQDGELIINWKQPRGNALQRNGGNLYRQISAIDIIKKMELERLHQEDTKLGQVQFLKDTPSLYQINRNPNSGLFDFKDKIIFYGDTVKDIHRTPILETMHGTEIVASVTDMLLNDDVFFTEVDNTWVYTSVLVLILMIGVIIVQPQINFVTANLSAMVIIFTYWLYNYQLFSIKSWIMPLVIPTLFMMAAIFAADAYRYWVQDKEKRQLTDVFSNYVSPQVMAEILKSPDKAMDNLKGNKKELTVIFTDIKNFTNTFEHEDPEKMVEQLNEYFDVMIDIILKYDGTIDKFMGDAVMAFFGAPYPLANNAEMACRAALDMQSALVELNKKWEREGKKKLHHGIGVSTGQMFVGNFGSRNNKDFTVMGSMVNLGARLESSTRDLDADIIVSERTYELLSDLIEVKDLGKITVKGFSDPVAVFELKAFLQKNDQIKNKIKT